jgi:hypothetical protein
MHKDISEDNVIFFKKIENGFQEKFDLDRPYLYGFRYSRKERLGRPISGDNRTVKREL